MRHDFIKFVLLSFCLISNSFAESTIVPKFDMTVSVSEDIYKYERLFTEPGILVLAIRNSGTLISQKLPVYITDHMGLSIGPATLEYQKREHQKLFYEVEYAIGGSGSRNNIKIPIVVDFSSISTGTVHVTANSPLLNLIPSGVLDQVAAKVTTLLDASKQRALSDYLDSISKDTTDANLKNLDYINLRIISDSYNNILRFGVGRDDVGLEKPLDFILSLSIVCFGWLLLSFLAFFYYYKYRKLLGKH